MRSNKKLCTAGQRGLRELLLPSTPEDKTGAQVQINKDRREEGGAAQRLLASDRENGKFVLVLSFHGLSSLAIQSSCPLPTD